VVFASTKVLAGEDPELSSLATTTSLPNCYREPCMRALDATLKKLMLVPYRARPSASTPGDPRRGDHSMLRPAPNQQ